VPLVLFERDIFGTLNSEIGRTLGAVSLKLISF
jgi:hypothetical protein